MPRLPYAATTLIQQVQNERKSATAQPHGDPDGFGVFRTIKFDKKSSPWVAERLQHDERVLETELTEAGYLHVTFSDRPAADIRDPFVLEKPEVGESTD